MTTSARSVMADWRTSRLTTNPAASTAARAACGSARSAGSTPPISGRRVRRLPRRPGSPRCRGPAHRGDVRPQAALTCWRARESATGRPPGSRVRQPAASAPWLTGAARDPRQPCPGPGRRRECPGTGGQPFPGRDDGALGHLFGQFVQGRRLAAGSDGNQPGGQLGRPREMNGASVITRQAAPADRPAQPQEDDRRLLFGLEPDGVPRPVRSPGRRRSTAWAGRRYGRGTASPRRSAGAIGSRCHWCAAPFRANLA